MHKFKRNELIKYIFKGDKIYNLSCFRWHFTQLELIYAALNDICV